MRWCGFGLVLTERIRQESRRRRLAGRAATGIDFLKRDDVGIMRLDEADDAREVAAPVRSDAST